MRIGTFQINKFCTVVVFSFELFVNSELFPRDVEMFCFVEMQVHLLYDFCITDSRVKAVLYV